jgi:hypothetical protein
MYPFKVSTLQLDSMPHVKETEQNLAILIPLTADDRMIGFEYA